MLTPMNMTWEIFNYTTEVITYYNISFEMHCLGIVDLKVMTIKSTQTLGSNNNNLLHLFEARNEKKNQLNRIW